jgi:hypothetical protein
LVESKRGAMGPSLLTRSFSRSVLSIRSLCLIIISGALAAVAPFAARAHEKWSPSTGDPGITSGVADVRFTASENAAIERQLRSLDHTLIQAIGANDVVEPARLLDNEFTWIDRDGRSRRKSDIVNLIGLLSAGADTNLTLQTYGRVALVTGTHRLTPDNVPAFFARVWIRQASGWRLLLYQETAVAEASVKEARYTVSTADWAGRCENPCRSLPYKPLSSEAQEIVASFMAGERAAYDGDAETTSRMLGDDVLFVTPDREQPMDKAERIASMRNFRHANATLPPPAVASMAVWVFGNAAVMSADQESQSGEMLRTTRIWAKRGGLWQLTFSQQTLVQ